MPVLVLITFLLVGCQSTTSDVSDVIIPTPWVCQETGTVVADTVPEPARGYAYDFFIYLPPCYETELERDYPVLYLVPGRSGGPKDWFNAGIAELVDELILSGQIPPFIIVHTDDTAADGQATTIFGDLLPQVEQDYRILAERHHRAAAGGSLGGIAAYRLAFQHPETFASAGMFGSGLVSGEEPALKGWLSTLSADQSPRLFLNTGEQDPLMLARAEVMVAHLEEAGIEHTAVFGPGKHTYSYWMTAMPQYLLWMAQDWE
ncbi:alpha/beta hydrolase-fold protein [Anaerolineales bacterium HSG25]|nr:alpha/beta hydrolase-fold protein [Anaerolineales bacterium HSG25]